MSLNLIPAILRSSNPTPGTSIFDTASRAQTIVHREAARTQAEIANSVANPDENNSSFISKLTKIFALDQLMNIIMQRAIEKQKADLEFEKRSQAAALPAK